MPQIAQYQNAGKTETVFGNDAGRRKEVSDPVSFSIELTKSPGWTLKIEKGRFAASVLSVQEDGKMTAVSTSCDCSFHSLPCPLSDSISQ